LGLASKRQFGFILEKRMDDLDPTGNPARVLAAICKARGEPLDDDVVEILAAYCDELVPVPNDVALAECARRQMTNEECGMWQARKKRCPDCPLGE